MKKEKHLIIIIIVLSTILIGITGFIIYDKFISKSTQECPECPECKKCDDPIVCPNCEDQIICPKCDDVQGVILNRDESDLNYQYYFSTNNKNYNEYSLILTSRKDSPNKGFFSITLHHGLESDVSGGYFKIENGKIRFSNNDENEKGSFGSLLGTHREKLQYDNNYYYIDFTYTNNTILNENREFKLVTNMGM